MDDTTQKPAMNPKTQHFLQQLRRQYLALYPIRHIDFDPSSGNSSGTESEAEPLYKHQDWIYDHLLSWKYQPAKDYQGKFLKGLIDTVEEGLRSEAAVLEEWELDDRLADRYSELLAASAPSLAVSSPEPSYKTYVYNQHDAEKSITLFEAQTTIEAGSTGLRTWTASLFLAEALLHYPNLLSGTSSGPGQRQPESSAVPSFPPVLELGAGTGFLSIFLSQIGCARIWSSDVGDEQAGFEDPQETDEAGGSSQRPELRFASETRRRGPLDGLIANLELNREGMQGEVEPVRLDWFHSLERPGSEDQRVTMIKLSRDLPSDLTLVATDVIYDPDLIEPLVSTIKLFLTHLPSTTPASSRSAIIAATVRNKDTLVKFQNVCFTEHLTIDTLAVNREQVSSVFWNANTWEGSDVVVMRITSRLTL